MVMENTLSVGADLVYGRLRIFLSTITIKTSGSSRWTTYTFSASIDDEEGDEDIWFSAVINGHLSLMNIYADEIGDLIDVLTLIERHEREIIEDFRLLQRETMKKHRGMHPRYEELGF